jgi:HK97 family phage prohead protease
MLTAAAVGALELRRAGDGSARLVGRFPYGAETELAPGRRETFAPGALEVRDMVHLLSQHEFGKPLASTAAGSLTVRSTDTALEFEARISPVIANTAHGRDTLAMIEANLAVGVSPGLRVLRGGETVERRGDELVRTVTRAELVELSIVTRPAYADAAVEARCWEVITAPRPDRGLDVRRRWRA